MTFNKTKTDPLLGQKINKHLTELEIQTPTHHGQFIIGPDRPTNEHKIETITENVRNTMNILGLDLQDDSLIDTPDRVAKMYINEIFYGLNSENFPKITVVENKFNYDEMLIEKNIEVSSLCEHHWQPIIGNAHIAYIPNGHVVGLSKLNRVTDYFCRRPQVQERLTKQILETLKMVLQTDNVAVVIDADHYCIKVRGIRDRNSSTTTSALSGAFKNDPATRSEFMSFINAINRK